MEFLKSEWMALWSTIGGVGNGELIFTDLVMRYSEPHRRYHTLAHIEHCVRELLAADSDGEFYSCEIELALWFHDVIYDTHLKDNEQKSAEYAITQLALAGQSAHVIEKVVRYIDATRHHAQTHDVAEQIVLDIDLTILGQPTERFDDYERQIREEYSWVPEELFRGTRASILLGMLSNDFIYQTKYFRCKYEEQARENLARSITRLTR